MRNIDYIEDYHELKPSVTRNSPVLDSLNESILTVCLKQQEELLWLADNILNIDVALGYHLDFIGGLVGQPRLLSDFNTEPYFGFSGSYQSKTFGSSLDPEVGGYWNSRSHFNTATSRVLTDDEYRRIIKARTVYNKSNCTANELVEVINLIVDNKRTTVQMLKQGLIQVKTDDKTGILAYFIDRVNLDDNILPVAAGVRIGLEEVDESATSGGTGGTGGTVEFSYLTIDMQTPDSINALTDMQG
jgi:hypothetical protein